MKKDISLLCIIGFIAGCSSGDGACVTNAVSLPGIVLTITDSIKKSPLVGAQAMFRDGDYSENAFSINGANGDSIITGAWDRPGLYSAKISKAGYRDVELTNLLVDRKNCEFISTHRNVELEEISN